MTDEVNTTPTEPTKVDTAASEACTRSGVFALLLSTALVLLIPYWLQRPNEIALGRYIGVRSTLAMRVDTLDSDPIWQKYKASHAAAESTPIGELVDTEFEVPQSGGNNPETAANTPAGPEKRVQTPAPRAGNDLQTPALPNPPTAPGMLVAVVRMKLNEISEIRDYLNQLNDADLLSRSRRVSNFFNFSIARWGQKRNDLLYRNAVIKTCATSELEVPNRTKGTDYFVPTFDKTVLLKCLNISDVRELAHFELPTFSNPTQLQGRVLSEVRKLTRALSRKIFSRECRRPDALVD